MTPDQLRRVLATAARSPSLHNTQPWLFEIDGDTIHVRADRRRQLPVCDPLGRELVLSCGAAAFCAGLAVRGLGLRCDLRWTRTEGDPDAVAALSVSSPLPITPEESRLLEAVALRRTDRTAFAPTSLPPALVVALCAAAQQEGAHLAVEQQPDRVQALQVAVEHADQVLRGDPDLREELATWVRSGRRPVEGLAVGALPDRAPGLHDAPPRPSALEPPAPEQAVPMVLSTDGDAPEDWARAGAALARVLLTATAAGLVARPHTGVLEVPALRSRFVAELGLVGRPQMVLRVGYPAGPGSAPTGRRPVPEVRIGRAGRRATQPAPAASASTGRLG